MEGLLRFTSYTTSSLRHGLFPQATTSPEVQLVRNVGTRLSAGNTGVWSWHSGQLNVMCSSRLIPGHCSCTANQASFIPYFFFIICMCLFSNPAWNCFATNSLCSLMEVLLLPLWTSVVPPVKQGLHLMSYRSIENASKPTMSKSP